MSLQIERYPATVLSQSVSNVRRQSENAAVTEYVLLGRRRNMIVHLSGVHCRSVVV